MMRIPMTELTSQYTSLKEEINNAIHRVIESGRFILGPEVEGFEREIATYCGVKYAIGVASGTDALIISLMACGVKPGDEVITTPFTFIATAGAIAHCGAIPVFVDIDRRTYNIDPNQIESKISNKTRAIIPVHLFGQPADMDAILKLSAKHKIKIVEDCAQALSAKYKGKEVGSIGDVGCFSFYPSKNLGAFGDGGMIVTNDSQIAEMSMILRQHGVKSTHESVMLGFNSRLDAIQAAILRVKFKHLDNWTNLRRQIASLYSQLLTEVEEIEPPYVEKNNTISASYYTIRLRNQLIDRDSLRQYLALKNVATAVHYPISLHLHQVFKTFGYKQGDFLESELAQEQVLSLPLYPEMRNDQVIEVVDIIKEFLRR